jgi:hypothetical protein
MDLLFYSVAALTTYAYFRMYRGSYAEYKLGRFRALVDSFRETYAYPTAVYKASSIIVRSSYLDWYAWVSTVRARKYSFVKFIQGGSTYVLAVHHPGGPKPVVEYAYFGDQRMDHLFHMLIGPSHDAERVHDVLLSLASTVRYKLMNAAERILIDPKSNTPDFINHDVIKKILSLSRPEELEKTV